MRGTALKRMPGGSALLISISGPNESLGILFRSLIREADVLCLKLLTTPLITPLVRMPRGAAGKGDAPVLGA